MDVEIIPAILVKTREELLSHIKRVENSVSSVHIDVMDNKFVPNKTIGTESFSNLPKNVSYEFHWMVQQPENYIEQVPGKHLHIVHVEAITNWAAIRKAVEIAGGKIGIAINPSTPAKSIEPYAKDISMVLVMSVNPGFYGQKYIPDVEGKIKELKKKFPKLKIEVDGGINAETAKGASAAGADSLAAASAIYHAPDPKQAVKEIKEAAEKAKGV